MNFDLRSADESVLKRAMELLEQRIGVIETRSSTTIDLTLTDHWRVVPYHPEGVDLARACAEATGLTHGEIMTIAGHDSTHMKDRVPTVMLFVPSVDGISHNEREFTRDEDAIAGVDLFTELTRRLVTGGLATPEDRIES